MVSALIAAAMLTVDTTPLTPSDRIGVMRQRESDWRIGPIVYHVFVDRFAPSATLGTKKNLYASPRRLREWNQIPERGRPTELGVWSHELDFWGGDLKSIQSKLDHVQGLSDVLYLNPVHEAFTNHKYDATNYDKIAPEYGTWADFESLASDVHKREMRLVLDGVFNHCGKANPIFQEALGNPNSVNRSWFLFRKEYPNGYRAWANVANLPEIQLEAIATREYFWLKDDSIVAKYLNAGADGWRLDVAHEIGFDFLAELTKSAHKHKPGSLVIGEAWNYPAQWTVAMDGILSIFLGKVILEAAEGNLTGRQMGESMQQLVVDCGIEPLMKSWIVLSNHDTQRLASLLPDIQTRHFAQAMQFTLPGAPLIYYGDEIGMEGADDPLQRGPMQWEKVTKENPDLNWIQKLVQVRKSVRSLRIGDFRSLVGEKLFGSLRTTEKALETTIIIANPTDKPVTETLIVPEPRLMGWTLMEDELSDYSVRIQAGTIRPAVPAKTVMVLTIDKSPAGRAQYKRMKDGQ